MLFSGRIRFGVYRGLCFGARAACAIPHPQKVKRGGEDAFFSHPLGVGVADGVGGYATQKIDPGVYTRNVMRYCLEIVQSTDCRKGISALETLNYGAYMAMKAGDIGGCPAVVVTIKNESVASILNLGDCGVLMVRDGKMMYKSEQQQHSFNCPFQLPSDLPCTGQQCELDLCEGDVIFCASDGVLDNVDVETIVEHLKNTGKNGCEEVAKTIAHLASVHGNDRKFDSPFAQQAAAAGFRYTGGKLDDITTVVTMVTPKDQAVEKASPRLITDLLNISQ